MKKTSWFAYLLAVGLVMMASASAFAQGSERITAAGVSIEYPTTWFSSADARDGTIYVANSEDALTAIEESTGEFGRDAIAISAVGPGALASLGLSMTMAPDEALDTFLQMLELEAEVVSSTLLDVPGATVYVEDPSVPGDRGQLYAFAFPGGTVLAIIQFGSDYNEVPDEAASILRSLRYDPNAEDAPQPLPTVEDAVAIAYGDSVDGELTLGTGIQLYSFEGTAGDVVTITLIRADSADFDPVLRLYTADGYAADDAPLLVNDDAEDTSIPFLNSQIADFELPDDATYVIAAASFAGGSGAFTVTLEREEAGSGTPGTAGELRQWASGATGSSQYGDPSWGFMQATGAPDTSGCGDFATAWAAESSTGKHSLTVTFDQPVTPSQINIYQTYNPGSIISVEIRNSATGDTVELPDSADPPGNTPCPGVFSLDVTGIDMLFDTVTIYLDQSIGGGWNEIDAVELVGMGTTTAAAVTSVEGTLTDSVQSAAYQVALEAGDVVTITVAAADTDLDPVVELYLAADGTSSDPLAENDDSGASDLGSRDSRIDRFRIDESGDYIIVVRGFALSTGSYTLSISGSGSYTVEPMAAEK
jgi:hypothetical protein